MLPEVVSAVRVAAQSIIIDSGFSAAAPTSSRRSPWGPTWSPSAGSIATAWRRPGQAGGGSVLELLEEEVKIALALLGVTKFSELDPTYFVHPASRCTTPHVHSAFPLVDLPTVGDRP